MFCSSSSTSTTHLPGMDVTSMHGDVETRALTAVYMMQRLSASAAERSSTRRLRCGAATISRVKGEERRAAIGTTFGTVRKTKRGG